MRRVHAVAIDSKRIRVLIAKIGLDVHWRGAAVVASMLRDEGMDVIYVGNCFPKEIIEAAIQEDVNVVGISTLGGGHLALGRELMEEAGKAGIKRQKVFLIGGVFPPGDCAGLRAMGFNGIFGPGATSEQISGFIRNTVENQKPKRTDQNHR